ncbi:MAG: hypothetical protein H5T91_01105 [Synergistetes bacterium]|nr:MAG: MgtE intracellular region [bacterium 42_11]MBC7331016.1 hypothetical protein [Synergistota bacterium]MDK2871593.1 MgtE intracellular domain [bacterium]
MKRIIFILFILLFAIMGTLIGLHFARVVDVKKIYLSAVYPYAIKLPYIGKYVERFTSDLRTRFTPIERRRMELETWAKRLRELEEKLRKELSQKEAELEAEKKKLEEEKAKLEEEKKRLAELMAKATQEFSGKAISEEEARRLASYYAAMRPADAAAIINNLDEDLAVAILKNLDYERAAKILTSLDPNKAARLISKMGREKR